MSAPALSPSLDAAIRAHDRTPLVPDALPVQEFLEALLALVRPSLAMLSVAQSERLEAAYQAGAKCIDEAGLLLAVPRDTLLILTAPEPKREPGAPVLKLLKAAQMALSHWLQPDGPNDNDTLDILVALLDGPKQRAAEAQAELDATHAELWRFLLRALLDGRESEILNRLAPQFAPDYNGCKDGTFAAHVAAALAEFKS